jgi:ribosomal protein S18 acetylase RimI-like enzyme
MNPVFKHPSQDYSNSMEFSLRPATQDDLAFVRRIYFETQRWIIEQYFGWDEARENEKFRHQFNPAETRIIMAENTDIGWVQTRIGPKAIEVLGVYLTATFQNRGLGTRLLAGLINEAKATGKAVLLSMDKANPSMELYKRLGFHLVREEERKVYMRWML